MSNTEVASEAPDGCLSCNREQVAAYLKLHNVDPALAEQVPPAQEKQSDVMEPCPVCGAIFRINHSVEEDWSWLVRNGSDGSTELIGVQYPNGDQKMATEMPFQQWKAYLKKGNLKISELTGKLSVSKNN